MLSRGRAGICHCMPSRNAFNRVVKALGNYLGHFGYRTETIQLSEYFDDLLQLGSDLRSEGDDPTAVALHKIAAGNQIRKLTKKNDIMALVAAGAIADVRHERNRRLDRKPNQRRSLPLNNTAYVISTVRRPEG